MQAGSISEAETKAAARRTHAVAGRQGAVQCGRSVLVVVVAERGVQGLGVCRGSLPALHALHGLARSCTVLHGLMHARHATPYGLVDISRSEA